MQEHFLESFCLRLGVGLVLALLVLPARAVNPRFYRIHLLIVLGLAVAAGGLAWSTADDLFWVALGVAGGACLAGSLFWTAQTIAAGWAALILAACSLLLGLTSLTPAAWSFSWEAGWLLADNLTASFLIGCAVTAMLLGHWYLIATGMSITPLNVIIGWLAAAMVARLVMALAWLAWWGPWATTWDSLAWLWLAVRWGVGFVGLAGLTWMAAQSARIRSTQSATGILYVVVIFAFFGELTDQLLQSHLQTLAGGAS